jgi:hypothetical protein
MHSGETAKNFKGEKGEREKEKSEMMRGRAQGES